MIMYQKSYTKFVFMFFVPLVFIGAFFLLNLTLAVINSSFNENNKKIKAKEKTIDRLGRVNKDGGDHGLSPKEFEIANRTSKMMRRWFLAAKLSR